MPHRHFKSFAKYFLIAVFSVFSLVALWWISSGLVRAYVELKRAHIFPTEISAVGWNNPNNALAQELASNAPYPAFSRTNSAYIEIGEISRGAGTAPANSVPSSNPTVLPTTEATTSKATDTPTVTLPQPVTDIPPATPTQDVIPLPVPTLIPDVSQPTSSTGAHEGPTLATRITSIAARAFLSVTNIAYATTTDAVPAGVQVDSMLLPQDVMPTSTHSIITATDTASTTTSASAPDAASTPQVSGASIATCTILKKPCYTIELSGFAVKGSLTDKKLRQISVSFSFANFTRQEEAVDDKLVVRYYHAGQWKQAGEIFLNKELSNATNGSYFSSVLDGLNAWEDLSDVRVLIEYERDSSSPTRLYLDSAWLDATYQDRAQEVFSGDVPPPGDAPENVIFDLNDKGDTTQKQALVLSSGETVKFPYVDRVGADTLVLRSSVAAFRPLSSSTPESATSYISITNTTKNRDTFHLYAAYPGGDGSVTELSQYMRNVPTTSKSPVYDDVSYYCTDRWQHASSSEDYTCPTSAEVQACSSLNESGENCLVQHVQVSSEESIEYGTDWVPVEMASTTSEAAAVGRGLPVHYDVTSGTVQAFTILPGQTIYLRAAFNTSDAGPQRVYLFAKGDTLKGSIRLAQLRREADLLALKERRMLLGKAALERAHANEQISEKADFGENELPEFKFRFKTQRSFFTRVRDSVAGRAAPFKVRDAHLIHESGTDDRVPVDIEYGSNNEWTLKLEELPRAYKPGKYTVELTMSEGALQYTDTVDFYWGVLAINPDKSIYRPDETVHFDLAAVDNNGDTVCNAILSLIVTSPSGESNDVPVENGGGCGHNNVTLLPDYIAEYPATGEGKYVIELSSLDDAGNILNTVTDSFSVANDTPYVIARQGPTRIYPYVPYTMNVAVTATEAFKGTVREILPEGFEIRDLGGATMTRADGVMYLTWNVAMDPGQTYHISYRFKAPEVSPYLYLAGAATLTDANGQQVYDEGRTWKIASDAVSIATGVAWLNGTTTTNGTELNNATAAAINWYVDDFDTTYFTHSTTTNPTRLTVNVAGDYFLAITVPWARTDGANTVSALEVDVRVNGVKQNVGVARTGSANRSTQPESSSHLETMLHNVQVGDYIEVYSRAINTVGTITTVMAGQASLYAEYISTSEVVFSAVATTTTSGTNVSPAATSSMVWYDAPGRVDSGYTHSNGSTPEIITLASQSDYLVTVTIPDDGATTDARARGRVILNGTMIAGGDFKQGYIPNSNGVTSASLQWSGIVHATTTNTPLSIAVQQNPTSAAATLTVNADQAAIYIQKLPTSDVYFGRATTTSSGTDWNPAATSSVLWQADDIKDASIFTHSTGSSAQNITVLKAGDYLLAFNNSLIGATSRSDPRQNVMLNGVMANGARVSTNFIRNSGGGTDTNTSGSLMYFLRNLSANDVISVQTVQNAVAGVMTADQNALLVLWRKAAQSSFIQNTERWYQNNNTEPPTNPWFGLLEGDSITSGNSATSSSILRLRMALQTTANTTAGADSFKLQYATGQVCSSALTWIDVGATTSAAIWRFHHNTGVNDKATLSSTTLSVSTVKESYAESNPSTSTPNSITSGQNGEWDWSLENNGAPAGTDYCFRMVQSSGQLLKSYVDYPQLVTNSQATVPTLIKLFDNEKVASTSPWFEFASSDANGENIHYQIQVSTDPAFASTVIDIDSATDFNNFINTSNTSARAPFASGETIRYTSTATLSNGTTYWWRVRAKDPTGTNTWTSYATARSFTIDTSVTVSTWFQTTANQFSNDTLSQLATTSTSGGEVQLSGANTTGTIWSPAIAYSSHTSGNSWGTASSSDTHVGGTILYQVEYFTSTSSWALIPDVDLAGNSAGTSTLPIKLSTLDTTVYNTLRFRANFTKTSATPILLDWTVNWGLSVNTPTLKKLFDNEKPATTTPQFQFLSTDPQGDKLQYQIQWSTDPTFTTGVVTRTSGTNAGFSDISSSTQSSPFASGDTIQMWVQAADVLTNGTTYWWRVRAIDPTGGNAYSFWSTARSFTVDTSLSVSTWFQTTTAQFATDFLTRTSALNNAGTAVTDTGKIAIYRAAGAGEAMTTSVYNHTFDTTVRQDDIYSMQYASSSIKLKSGYYAVLYGARFDSTGGTNRSEIQTNLSLASTSLPIGWSQAFVRRNTTATQGFASGGGIIKVLNDNDTLVLQSFRTDTNAGATVQRLANTPSLQLIRLDSAWNYLRLSKAATQAGPTSASWVPVTYDREDEVDTTVFTHVQGSASITLKSTGHYLIFANTYGSLATGVSNDTQVAQKITLGGTDVQGGYTTVYMRGNAVADGDYQGAASIGMIVESTTTNQVLTVQLRRDAGTSAWKIDADSTGTYVDRTGLTIVKIPEGDFIALQSSTNYNINPASRTAFTWNFEGEKDIASFTHSTTTNPSRITTNIAGDYLFLSANYAKPGTTANANWYGGWDKNGGALLQYGQGGAFNSTATGGTGGFLGSIMPSAINTDYYEAGSQALGTAGTVAATIKGAQAFRIASLTEADPNPQTIVSPDINFTDGTGPKWASLSWNHTTPGSTSIKYQVYYLSATSTYSLVPDALIPGNISNSGTTTSPIDLSGLSRITYATLRAKATLTCSAGLCPTVDDWTVSWALGSTISGTAKQFDQTTNVTSGTVAVAVNGVLQSGKTGTISAGTWSIPNVTLFTGDVVTVFISSASGTTRAVAITKYAGVGNVTAMKLYEMHVTLGSADNPTLSNADIGQYDNSVSGNAAIFEDVNISNTLNVCAVSGCFNSRLLVQSGTTYRPDTASAGNVSTRYIQIDGALLADGNTLTVSGSWKNTGNFTASSSAVIFNATSTTETIDSTGAATSSFNTVTFGQSSGTATWNLSSALLASSTVTVNFGTLAQNGANLIWLDGDLTFGASGAYTKGTATTTFSGSTSKTWTDNTATKQDMGIVVVDGAAKTLLLGSGVKSTTLTIGADDILNANGSNTIEVTGNSWNNKNTFTPSTGTVLFSSTSAGNSVVQGASSFNNLTFVGSGGTWSFTGATLGVGGNFTVSAGTVTLPSATTTVSGSFDATGGTFVANSGSSVLLNASSGSKTINPSTSPFYDLFINGAGSFSFTGTNATTTRNFVITAGTVTLSSGIFAVGGLFDNAGTFSHNNGTMKFTSTSSGKTIKAGGSNFYNLVLNGTGGVWTFLDTNATSTFNFTITNGSTTLPIGTMAVGGSFTNAGTFSSLTGAMRFTATTTGMTVNPGSSLFYDLVFNSAGGGWTITNNATSTRNTSITNAASFTLSSGQTLAVLGTFSNAVSGANTTWTGSILSLQSGTTYSINTKSLGSASYATLVLGPLTKISMWNSSATTPLINATAYLYSQNNAAVNGALNIYGAYTNNAGEYWSAATDFDGTALAGASQRAAAIKIASGSSVTISGGIFRILGTSTATTTIDNQGSGTYGLSMTGGTLNAQYYSVRNINATGFALSGSPGVATLDDGDFQLAVAGGSLMTVASTVIDQNPTLIILRPKFATSSGATTGFNVTETGTPSAGGVWYYKDSFGGLDGEAYDNDPGGNPGYIQWNDSGFVVTISGHVYADHGSTVIGNPPCDGVTPVVTIITKSHVSFSGACAAGTGAYSIPNVTFIANSVLTVYLNTNGGKRAVTVARGPTVDITNLDLYQNSVIVRNEDATALSVLDMQYSDASTDSDILFTVATSTQTLTVKPDTELYVWDNKSFTPAGTVTLQSGGSGSALDGRLYLAPSARFTATGAESHSIGGGLTVSSGALLNTASSTFTFTATTTLKSITSTSTLSFWNLTFNGSGGSWSLDTTAGATTTVQNTTALTAGTLVGKGDLVVHAGDLAGSGTVTMTGGIIKLDAAGNFGNANSWQVSTLILGDGSTVGATTKTAAGTTTVAQALLIAASHTLNAGSSPWVLSKGGVPLVINGTFAPQTAPFLFTATTSTLIANTTYAALTLAPSAAGSPTFTLKGGTLGASSLTVGNGTNPVTVDADANDPSMPITGAVLINPSATLTASNVGAFDVSGSWNNNGGTFTHSSGGVRFVATTTGFTINAGSSSFYDLTFNSAVGGWTINNNATSTHNTNLTNAAGFTLSSGKTLAVLGTFTNAVSSASTTWTGSTLYLNSGTGYTINTKSTGNATYANLLIGTSTAIRMWNSSAATTTTRTGASLYSQNNAGVNGTLNIYGTFTLSSGAEYWNYATDFDGTVLGSPRQVNVRVASSTTISVTGGLLDIIGASGATTTIANQGTGTFSWSVSSAASSTLNAQYYSVRNTDSTGINITGSPSISSLSDGDLELGLTGGTTLTVAGSVITANPLLLIQRNRFATSTGVSSGFNVTATGSTASYWKFNLHYGGRDGEAYDNDPTGDPGYLQWDDSANAITISGKVYSDEGSTVSTVCDNATQVVRLKVQGAGVFTSACNSSTGLYTINGIHYNPGDTLTTYLDTNGGRRGVTVSADPLVSTTTMDVYENRVIVRDEGLASMTILKMSKYDSTNDADVPFTTTIGSPNTVTIKPDTKVLVWQSKTFAPGGNVTLQSGGSGNIWDGTLELQTNAVYTAAASSTNAIGGSLLVGSGATIAPTNSTFSFTATTSGKTISFGPQGLYNVLFSGAAGGWTLSDVNATTSNNFTISAGTVVLASGTTTVGGSFSNSANFNNNSGAVLLTATSSGNIIKQGGFAFNDLVASSTGTYQFTDTNATTTRNLTIYAGTVTLPTGTMAIGGNLSNAGTFAHNNGTVKFISTSAAKLVKAGSSNFYNVTFNGVGGAWTFLDTSATVLANFSITNGSTTLPVTQLSVGGSYTNTGTFTVGTSTVLFNATTTGFTVNPGASSFYDLTFNSSAGGWTVTGNSTSTHNTSLTSAAAFTLNSGVTLAVQGTFSNAVSGANTTWTGSILSLQSGTSYTLNAKTAGSGNATYGTIVIGASTNIRMWNSSAATVLPSASGSLYSQNNANVAGALNIYGAYTLSAGSDYWSYATDFDGVALGGSSRIANVQIANGSTVAIQSSGVLNIIGTASATTTIANQGSGTYAWSIAGGTLNASYYSVRNTDTNGLNITGVPTISSLSNADFQLGITGGSMITVAGTALDANASLTFTNMRFATSSGVSSGYNINRTGTPLNAWTFTGHYGNFAGEAYDNDGINACGFIRWDDSVCDLVSQEHFRFRNDDGGEGALATQWYNVSWSKRQRVGISNTNATAYTNLAVKMTVTYASAMKSDFSDLRFTDSSGTTTLNYWIESYTSSASAVVWVKIPSLPASGSAITYMYYGNSGAASAADGTNTFKTFEDFESNSLAGYSGNTTLFQTSTTFPHNYTYGLDAGTNFNQRTTNGIYKTGSLMAQGDTISFYQYVNAAQQDEPCVLFGVQASAQNYAVCLDAFPSQAIEIAKNVTSNDGSGTVLTSTAVTYTTGWYHVVIDWLSGGTINVNVYDSSNALFASLSTTTTTYSSGGYGFSYWFQNGGWDYFSVNAYTAVAPTARFGVEQTSNGATWIAAEDTNVTGLTVGNNVRLRFSIQNTGTNRTGQYLRFQIAPRAAALNCESVPHGNFTDVPTTSGGCGSAVACMTTSSQFTNLASSTGSLTYPASMKFTYGNALQDPSNQTIALAIGANTATEVEYNFQFTNNATDPYYCLRTTNAGADLDNYQHVAQASIKYAPFITNLKLNNDNNIALTESVTTSIYLTASTTDYNGYADIIFATSTIFRSGVTSSCAQNDNNCYRVASTSCVYSNCAGYTCSISCRADLQYIADPTDIGTYASSSQHWFGQLFLKDSTGLTATATSSVPVNVLTLYALAINTSAVNFGSLQAGQDTGSANATTTIINTGNSTINIDLSGTNLAGNITNIPVGSQKYATSTFIYGSCTVCNFLSGSATNVAVNLGKPTATTTPVTGDLYWGITVPNGTDTGLHQGTTTFIAVSP